MKNNIYTTIQKNNKINFDDLYKKCSEFVSSKQELGQQLKILETEKSIFQYNSEYYDLAAYPITEGYTQWGLNGFCWIADKNIANPYGISADLSDNLTTIYNKRDTFYGSYIKGREITDNDKKFVIVTESAPIMDLKIIATYSLSKNEWIIINSNTSFTFANTLSDLEDGNVSIFNYTASNNTYDYNISLGNKKDNGIETLIIEALTETKPAPISNIIKEVTSSNKLNKPFYTIDSIYTSDVDDAIWQEKTEDGYKLYVAIANVSAYVLPGDEQDTHAKEVCTSIYLPHHVTHMLDRTIAEKYGSLNVGETKTALICEMDFDNSGNMLNKEFYEAEITVRSRLSYNDVEKIIVGDKPQESLVFNQGKIVNFNSLNDAPEIVESLKFLEKFAHLKSRQQERDYFVVETPEFALGEDGKIDHLYMRNENEISQKMVESAMLSANIAAAQFISEKLPDFGMFRNQYAPATEERPKPAFYNAENEGHWGLQTDFYTHFTSPIRRYCDLIVHRVIKDIIYNNEQTYTKEELNEISEQINYQQYRAKQAEIKSRNLLVPQYLEKLQATSQLDTELTIVDFSNNGLVCKNSQHIEFFIPTFKLESYVTRVLNKYLTPDNKELPMKEKTDALEFLNKTWNVYMQLGVYNWTDERKNALYQFQKKQYNNKPKY